MTECVEKLQDKANWKLRNLLRTTRYYDVPTLMEQYKVRLLGFIEYRTPGIYHCCASLLNQIDKIQDSFLNTLMVSKKDALFNYNLAPLKARRDIGMLGVIHRAVLGEGPEHFRNHFFAKINKSQHIGRETLRRHSVQLETYRKWNFLDIVPNSILGLVDVYNLLPPFTVEAGTVKEFQGRLQGMMSQLAQNDETNWDLLFCPRVPLHEHRLRKPGFM